MKDNGSRATRGPANVTSYNVSNNGVTCDHAQNKDVAIGSKGNGDALDDATKVKAALTSQGCGVRDEQKMIAGIGSRGVAVNDAQIMKPGFGSSGNGFGMNVGQHMNMNMPNMGMGMGLGMGMGMGMGMGGNNVMLQMVLQMQEQQQQRQQQFMMTMMNAQRSFQQEMMREMQQYKKQQRTLYDKMLATAEQQHQYKQGLDKIENEAKSTANFQPMRVRDIYILGQAMLIIKQSQTVDGKDHKASELRLMKTLGADVDSWRDPAKNKRNGKLVLKYAFDLRVQFQEQDMNLSLPEFQAMYQSDPTRFPKLNKNFGNMASGGYNLGNWKNYMNVPDDLIRILFPFTCY